MTTKELPSHCSMLAYFQGESNANGDEGLNFKDHPNPNPSNLAGFRPFLSDNLALRLWEAESYRHLCCNISCYKRPAATH